MLDKQPGEADLESLRLPHGTPALSGPCYGFAWSNTNGCALTCLGRPDLRQRPSFKNALIVRSRESSCMRNMHLDPESWLLAIGRLQSNLLYTCVTRFRPFALGCGPEIMVTKLPICRVPVIR
jgi:hypothetical protein